MMGDKAMFDKLKLKRQPKPETIRKILICQSNADLIQCRKHIHRIGGTVVKELPLVNGLVCELPDVLMYELESTSGVKRIEDDIKFHTSCLNYFFRRRSSPQQKPQEVGWGVRRIGAPEAWPISRGAQVAVAVIDTGVQLDHPDLQGRLGKGFNAISTGRSANDDNGHGTHVAGIIAAADNDIGVVGVAPEVIIHPVKVLDSTGAGSLSDVIEGLQWCIEQKVDLINMSLGARQDSETFREMIKMAAERGIVIVAAAGNSGPAMDSIDYPARYPETIAVAASDQQDAIADFSSRGREVDITAPGVEIPSTYLKGEYRSLSGTSMATPHITGTIALLKARKAELDLAEIKAILRRSAYRLPNFAPEYQGVGLVQAGVAVNKYSE